MILNDFDSDFGRDNDHRYEMLRQLAKIAPLTPAPTEQTKKAENPKSDVAAWNLLERMPTLADDEFKILITPAVRGSIPASIWRSAHVVYFDDL